MLWDKEIAVFEQNLALIPPISMENIKRNQAIIPSICYYWE